MVGNLMAAMEADMSDEAGAEAPAKKKLSGKVLVLYIALPLLLLIGGGAGAYFSGLLGGGEHEADHEPVVAAAPVFYDLPDFLVNLSGPPPQHYLKMRVTLQIADPEIAKTLDAQMPRVLDSFQTFLREMRPEDLQGSEGMLRLKEELLRRINLVLDPTVVSDVLFKEIIVQ